MSHRDVILPPAAVRAPYACLAGLLSKVNAMNVAATAVQVQCALQVTSLEVLAWREFFFFSLCSEPLSYSSGCPGRHCWLHPVCIFVLRPSIHPQNRLP